MSSIRSSFINTKKNQSGKPAARRSRNGVVTILSLLAEGYRIQDIPKEIPSLSIQQVQASLNRLIQALKRRGNLTQASTQSYEIYSDEEWNQMLRDDTLPPELAKQAKTYWPEFK